MTKTKFITIGFFMLASVCFGQLDAVKKVTTTNAITEDLQIGTGRTLSITGSLTANSGSTINLAAGTITLNTASVRSALTGGTGTLDLSGYTVTFPAITSGTSFLKGNGSGGFANAGTQDYYPSQSGKTGKALVTDGTTASWTAIANSVAGRTGIITLSTSDISGLGGAATLNVGTSTGTVAAGDDSRITGAAQKSSNLSDLANAATARTNLGLGTAATQASSAFEPALGNPASNGYVLSSTTGGTRSWIAAGGISDAPNDGTLYARQSAAWTQTGTAIRSIYIFAAFVTGEDKLRICASTDGTTWNQIHSSYCYNDPNGDGVRDPVIRYIPSTGTYWLLYTAGNFGNVNYFGMAKSTDLINWTYVRHVSVPVTGNGQTWGPFWFIEANGNEHIFVNVSTDGDVTNHQYEMHPTTPGDYSAWSSPVQVTGFPSNTILQKIILKGGTYYAFIKNDSSKYQEIYSCSTLLGTYSSYKTGDWAGWGQFREGTAIVNPTGTTWQIWMDDYAQGGIYYTKSTDDWATWSSVAYTTNATPPDGLNGAGRNNPPRMVYSNPDVLYTSDRKIIDDVLFAFAGRKGTLTENLQISSVGKVGLMIGKATPSNTIAPLYIRIDTDGSNVAKGQFNVGADTANSVALIGYSSAGTTHWGAIGDGPYHYQIYNYANSYYPLQIGPTGPFTIAGDMNTNGQLIVNARSTSQATGISLQRAGTERYRFYVDGANSPSYYFSLYNVGTVTNVIYNAANSSDLQLPSGNLTVDTAGKTVKIKSGSNAKAGTFTLSSGTVTVSNTSVTANSVIVMTLKTASGSVTAAPYVSAITAGTSFTVTAGGSDNSTYNYVILEVN